MDLTVEICAGCEAEADVLERLGQPNESVVAEIPIDSDWGMQDSLRYKIAPGEAVQQWLYYGNERDLCIWFAKVATAWKVTLVHSVPVGLMSEKRESGEKRGAERNGDIEKGTGTGPVYCQLDLSPFPFPI